MFSLCGVFCGAALILALGSGFALSTFVRSSLRCHFLHFSSVADTCDALTLSSIPCLGKKKSFDKCMNLVVDDADEVLIMKEIRRAVGRILKGLIHVKKNLLIKEDTLYFHEIIGVSAPVTILRVLRFAGHVGPWLGQALRRDIHRTSSLVRHSACVASSCR